MRTLSYTVMYEPQPGPEGTLRAILRQAELTVDDFVRLL